MKLISLFLVKLLFILLTISFSTTASANQRLYNKLDLKDKISYNVFAKAYKDFKTKKAKQSFFTVIDYGQPSSKKRFAIIDVKREKVIVNTYVAHGTRSGGLFARKFSNTVNSRQTSLGIYKTAETYYGKHGYSLRLDGLSKTNNKARKRYIVVHGADYANPSVVKSQGALGRSWGCPALPKNLSRKIINLIKNGSYIYAYA